MKTIKDFQVKNKCVFVRNDFNVPLNPSQEIADDTRIRESLPTLKYLLENKARIICASHLGRPKGGKTPEFSLKPVADRLVGLLKCRVHFPGETVGPVIDQTKKELEPGEILLLENLRFEAGETKNDETLAKELAQGVDIYVNDAFGASHRSHSSIDAITRFVPKKTAGLLLKKEIEYLSMGIQGNKGHYLVIMGGAKVVDKIPVVTNLLKKANTIMIGGAMAYTFLKARGENVGNSRVESEFLPMCSEILATAAKNKVKIMLPVDHIAAVTIEPDVTIRMVGKGESIPENMMGLDIGFDTIKLYIEEINKAKLIIWNGPMGVFEIDNFSAGTMEIAKALASSKATTIVGGGDSVAAVNLAGVADHITHISTGGGASLEYLSGKELPGIKALEA